MAYDEQLAERVRVALADVPDVSERTMFGGLVFMAGDHMACGIVGDELMLRLGAEGAEGAVRRPGVRSMQMMRSRTMVGYVLVAPQAAAGDDALRDWLRAALAFVATLPPKKARR